jgi:hypothetical protein
LWPGRQRTAGFTRVELRDQLVAAGVCGAICYVVILALFPYVFMHPLTGFVDSVLLMSRYDWPGSILFDGQMVRGQDVPWNYAPQWLVIGSPPVTVALAVVGLALLVGDAVRRRRPDPAVLLAAGLFLVPLLLLIVRGATLYNALRQFLFVVAVRRRRPDPAVLLAAGLFLVPLLLLIVRGATLYNALRQFLFVVPGMILLGVFALIRLWRAARALPAPALSTGLAIVLAGVVAAGHAEALAATVRLYPLEYVYFSPLVGGFAGAHDRYEKDYWRACETVSLHWIDAHRTELGIGTQASVSGVNQGGYFPLPAGMRPAGQDERPDIVISNEFTPPSPDYPVVHQILAEGVPLCSIQLDPARYPAVPVP